MLTITVENVAKILVARKFYNFIPSGMTKGLILAAGKFLESVEPGVTAQFTNAQRLRVAVYQADLKVHGFDPGKIDGYIGPMTLEAQNKFERSLMSLPPDNFRDWPDPPPVWPLEKDMDSFYGEKGQHQTKVPCPYGLVLAWDKSVNISNITIHEKVADSLSRILDAVLKEYGVERINAYRLNYFGGSLNVRLKRGSTTQWSIHSWGCAIDWLPQENQLRWGMDRASLARPEYVPFWSIWEAEGWVSLGRSRNYDWMHVQAARLNA